MRKALFYYRWFLLVLVLSLEPPVIKLRMVCFNDLLLSWNINSEQLKGNLKYEVTCFSQNSIFIDEVTDRNSILLEDLMPGINYLCNVRAKLSTTNITASSSVSFASGLRQLNVIKILSNNLLSQEKDKESTKEGNAAETDYVLLEFEESISSFGNITAEDVNYKIFCKPFYYAEGKGSPLVLKNVDGGTYDCTIHPVDRCDKKGVSNNFTFTTAHEKQTKDNLFLWVIVVVIGAVMFLAAFLTTMVVTNKNMTKLKDIQKTFDANTAYTKIGRSQMSITESAAGGTTSYQGTGQYYISSAGNTKPIKGEATEYSKGYEYVSLVGSVDPKLPDNDGKLHTRRTLSLGEVENRKITEEDRVVPKTKGKQSTKKSTHKDMQKTFEENPSFPRKERSQLSINESAARVTASYHGTGQDHKALAQQVSSLGGIDNGLINEEDQLESKAKEKRPRKKPRKSKVEQTKDILS